MDKKYRYEEIENYFNSAIEDAERTGNKLIKRITLFSILESIAQEYYNYPNNNADTFEKFICEFSSINYLDKYEPITIYYEMKNKYENIESDLNYSEDSNCYYADQIIAFEGSKKIVNEAELRGLSLHKHTYAQLIYKYRCKLVHEFRVIGVSFNSMEIENDINYISCGFEPNMKWIINIPYTFLKNLTNECIKNYLKYCKNNDRDPYVNAKEYDYWYE